MKEASHQLSLAKDWYVRAGDNEKPRKLHYLRIAQQEAVQASLMEPFYTVGEDTVFLSRVLRGAPSRKSRLLAMWCLYASGNLRCGEIF